MTAEDLFNSFHVSASILQKFVHTLGGIYIWEYFSTFWFEWSFISRKRPYRWTIWIYGVIRLFTLVNVLTNLVQTNLRKSIGCQGWLYFEFITAYAAMILASFILVLKIAAIWDKNKWILAPCVGAWLANIAFVILCIATTKARYSKGLGDCVLVDGRMNRDATLASLCSEMVLLAFMLTGLVRQRDHYLGRLLFHHGLIWLLVAIFAQVPLLVLLSLNPHIQDFGNLIFHSSTLLSIAMCVTRLYRSLITVKDFQPRQKSLSLVNSASNPTIVFASINSNNSRAQSRTVERLTISFPEPESSTAKDSPTEKEKSTDVAMFGVHDAV